MPNLDHDRIDPPATRFEVIDCPACGAEIVEPVGGEPCPTCGAVTDDETIREQLEAQDEPEEDWGTER